MSVECLLCGNEVVNDVNPWVVCNDHDMHFLCDDCMQAIFDGRIIERLMQVKP